MWPWSRRPLALVETGCEASQAAGDSCRGNLGDLNGSVDGQKRKCVQGVQVERHILQQFQEEKRGSAQVSGKKGLCTTRDEEEGLRIFSVCVCIVESHIGRPGAERVMHRRYRSKDEIKKLVFAPIQSSCALALGTRNGTVTHRTEAEANLEVEERGVK